MYMFVSDLLILSRADIAEINNKMQLHGGGRIEEKHEHEECTCVWQHSHVQHGNELSGIKLGSMRQGLPWGKHMFVKW